MRYDYNEYDNYYYGGGYDWDAGMSNRAVFAYENGEMPKSKWTKKTMTETLCRVYPGITGLEKLTKEEMFQAFFYCSSWHHCSSAFNKVYFYHVDRDIENPNQVIADIISNRKPKVKKEAAQNLYVTALVEYKVSQKSRYGKWKTVTIEDVVQYRSADKLVSTWYGKKRISCMYIVKKIEQKTKYADPARLKK